MSSFHFDSACDLSRGVQNGFLKFGLVSVFKITVVFGLESLWVRFC